MDDGIPVNSAIFADEETWFELIGTAGRTFSYMHHVQLVDLPKLQAPNCAKGTLKKSQMWSWIMQARIY